MAALERSPQEMTHWTLNQLGPDLDHDGSRLSSSANWLTGRLHDGASDWSALHDVEGLAELSHSTPEGVRFHFSSAENLDLFRADPRAYQVAWGGWCAIAIAGDGTFFADPESFLVVGQRVFLFHDSIFFDAKAAWLKRDQDRVIRAGDAYWERLVDRP